MAFQRRTKNIGNLLKKVGITPREQRRLEANRGAVGRKLERKVGKVIGGERELQETKKILEEEKILEIRRHREAFSRFGRRFRPWQPEKPEKEEEARKEKSLGRSEQQRRHAQDREGIRHRLKETAAPEKYVHEHSRFGTVKREGETALQRVRREAANITAEKERKFRERSPLERPESHVEEEGSPSVSRPEGFGLSSTSHPERGAPSPESRPEGHSPRSSVAPRARHAPRPPERPSGPLRPGPRSRE